jgi:hypothetical protein
MMRLELKVAVRMAISFSLHIKNTFVHDTNKF